MGTLYRNPSLQDARITDMLQGDEIVNITYLDMAKVQMMLFTIVGALVYCGVLYQLLTNPVPAESDPDARLVTGHDHAAGHQPRRLSGQQDGGQNSVDVRATSEPSGLPDATNAVGVEKPDRR